MHKNSRLAFAAWRGVLTVIGAFLGNLTLGAFYTFGNMSPYISSYMTAKLGQKIAVADTTWIYGATVAGQGSLMLLGGIMERRFGPRAAILGCILMSSGITLTYFTVDIALYAVVVTYGALNGLGVSLAYIAFLAGGMRWFPGRQGLISGIIASGFGLGPLVFNPIQTHFLNPRNLRPERSGIFAQKEILDRVPSLFLLLGCIYSTLQLIACLLASKVPKNLQNDQPCSQGTEQPGPSECSKLTETKEDPLDVSLTPFQFLKKREFYLLWLIFLVNNSISFYFNSMYKAYGQTFIQDDHFLAMIGAIGALFNCVGRIAWGLLIDRISFKVLMRYQSIGILVLLLTLPSCSLSGKYAYGSWTCALHFFMSSTFVLVPSCISRNFGAEHAGSNYGLVFSNTIIGGILSAAFTQHLSKLMGYTAIIYTLSSMSVCSFLLTVPFREKLR